MRAVFLDEEQVGGGHPAVLTESHAHAALEAHPGESQVVFLGAGQAHHDRSADLAGQIGRDGHGGEWHRLGTESAATVFRHEYEIFLRNAQHARQDRH